MKRITLIFIVLLFPYIVLAQFDPLGGDIYGGSYVLPPTLSGEALQAVINNVIDEETLIKARAEVFGNRNIYDMFGNHIIYGIPLIMLNHTVNNYYLAESYGGTFREEFQFEPYETVWFKYLSAGIEFPINNYYNRIIMGGKVAMFFTPYTLKKLTLYGLRYDLKLGNSGYTVKSTSKKKKKNKSKKKSYASGEKSYKFRLKAFATPKFREVSQYVYDIDEAININDRLFYAVRSKIDIGRTIDFMPEILKGNYLGVTYVHQQLRNGFHSDNGSFLEFLNSYINTNGQNLKLGDVVTKEATIYGVDFSGTIGNIKYNIEYDYNTREDHTIVKGGEVLNVDNTQYTSYTTVGEVINANALTVKLKDSNLLEDIVKEPKVALSVTYWNISDKYGASWAVDDDDDKDAYLDEDLTRVDSYFPYEVGDEYFNEPQSAVIYSEYNKNDNKIPDYKEDFMLFDCDRYFTASPLFFEDINNNGIMDYEENDLDPDFPYDRDRTGTKGYVRITPFNWGNFIIGGVYNKMISQPTNTTVSFMAGYSISYKLFNKVRLRGRFAYNKVSDKIKDNYISLNTYKLIEDSLAYQDNSIFKFAGEIKLINYKGLRAAVKTRRTYNIRYFDDRKNIFGWDILKIGYKYKVPFMKKLSLIPQFKMVRGKNYFYEPDGMRILISSDSIIADQTKDMKLRATIFKAQYNFTGDIYLIGGIQSRQLTDYYKEENTSDRTTYALQFVVKGQQNIFKSSRPGLPVAVTIGYKYVKEEFEASGFLLEESQAFAKFLISL